MASFQCANEHPPDQEDAWGVWVNDALIIHTSPNSGSGCEIIHNLTFEEAEAVFPEFFTQGVAKPPAGLLPIGTKIDDYTVVAHRCPKKGEAMAFFSLEQRKNVVSVAHHRFTVPFAIAERGQP